MRISTNHSSKWQRLAVWIVPLVLAFLCPISHAADGDRVIPSGRFVVSKATESISMVVNTARYLTLDKPIDEALIQGDTLIAVRPTGRSEVLVSANATGVAQVDLVSGKEVYSVQIVVTGDGRELQAILNQEFPSATLNVRPIQSAVIISGQVTADEHVEHVIAIAEQYFPNVINRIEVIGVHTVMLQTQVMEISRTKLRQLGIDWQMNFSTDYVTQSASGLIGPGSTTTNVVSAANETFKFGVLDSSNGFFGFIRALRQNNLAKVMAEPTVVAIDGRPASFNSGGEFPILVPAGLGQVGVEFREFGTRLDFVAKVRGDGRIYLEVRPTISEVDPGRSVQVAGTSVPGLRSRFVDTAVELRAGQTLALAGLLQMRTEAESVGIAGLADIPYLGALFRSNREVQNEVELLILVTPNFAGAMEANEVPEGGPGYNSMSPLDRELYWKGYLEVPTTGGNDACPPAYGPSQGVMPGPETITPMQSVPMLGSNPNAYRPNNAGMPNSSFGPNNGNQVPRPNTVRR